MPTYDYQCLDCGIKFELFQRMTEDPIQECRDCHGRVKRLIGAGAGLIFKGSGFYITDYRGDGYKEAAKKDKAPSSGEGGKSDEKKKGGDKKSGGDAKSDSGKSSKSSESKSSSAASSDS